MTGALMLALTLTGDGCAPDAATQIVVRVFADDGVAVALQSVTLTAQREGAARPFATGRFTPPPAGRDALPGEVVLVPRDPTDLTSVVVTVTGALPDRATLTQTARVRFGVGRTLYLAMTLTAACLPVSSGCAAPRTCRDGACVPPELTLGDQRCVDLRDDPANCGVCGHACAATPAHGVASCQAGACGIRCEAGYVAAAGACLTTPPRPIAPLSTATVTSRRPTLRWRLAPDTDGALVEVCRDRACAAIEQSLEVAGDHATLPEELAPGVHFWRVRGRIGVVTSALPNPVWEFVVGHRSAAADTSGGTTADFNGDGYADLVVGASDVTAPQGGACVYLGSREGLAVTPATTLTGPDRGDGFGHSVASAGDVNGDGFADLVIGAPGLMPTVGRAYVYLGGSEGLAATPATILTGGPGISFGSSVASAGDINGDGFADLVVGAPGAMSNTGRVYVYLGGAGGLATTPATTLADAVGAFGNFGHSTAGVGDINGDGFADLVVGAPGAMSNTGRAYVYPGSSGGLAAAPATTLTGPALGDGFGFSVASAGDVNGDGYADLVVGAPGAMSKTGLACVFLGSREGLAATPVTVLNGPDGTLDGFGISVASAGDVNGDGHADLVVGVGGVHPIGRAYVYPGSGDGLAATPTTVVIGQDSNFRFGNSVASAGDVNGDGYADLAVGAPAQRTGRAYVYFGSDAGLVATPATTLTSPNGTLENFGYSVASADDVSFSAEALFSGASLDERFVWTACRLCSVPYLLAGGRVGRASAPGAT